MCQIFHSRTGELLFQEANANSVAFNNLYEDMLAFSGDNTLSIKVRFILNIVTFSPILFNHLNNTLYMKVCLILS